MRITTNFFYTMEIMRGTYFTHNLDASRRLFVNEISAMQTVHQIDDKFIIGQIHSNSRKYCVFVAVCVSLLMRSAESGFCRLSTMLTHRLIRLRELFLFMQITLEKCIISLMSINEIENQ